MTKNLRGDSSPLFYKEGDILNTSKKGLELIKKWEGCRLRAYQDCVGVWTIGYGITNADWTITNTTIKKGFEISQKKADFWLKQAIIKLYEPKVNKYMDKYNFTQNEYDALVSFAYNIGSIDGLTDNGKRSKTVIAKKLLEYCKAGGKYVKGLYERRLDEYRLFTNKIAEKETYKMPTLRKGDSGRCVMIWQVVVKAKIDGVFGGETERLTKKFQEKVGLQVDGVVGFYSWSKGFEEVIGE